MSIFRETYQIIFTVHQGEIGCRTSYELNLVTKIYVIGTQIVTTLLPYYHSWSPDYYGHTYVTHIATGD